MNHPDQIVVVLLLWLLLAFAAYVAAGLGYRLFSQLLHWACFGAVTGFGLVFFLPDNHQMFSALLQMQLPPSLAFAVREAGMTLTELKPLLGALGGGMWGFLVALLLSRLFPQKAPRQARRSPESPPDNAGESVAHPPLPFGPPAGSRSVGVHQGR
jgi:hypothetical protein